MNLNVLDVCFIGTSLTYGRWYWQENLERRLQLVSERPLRFYDFGAPGATAAILSGAKNAPIRMRPRVFILEAGMNDASVGVGVPAFTASVAEMINAIKANDASAAIFLMTMNPAISPAGAGLVANLPAYYQALRNLSAAHSVGLIDTTPSFGTPNTTQIPDGVHPTADVMRAVVVPKIIEALTEAP